MPDFVLVERVTMLFLLHLDEVFAVHRSPLLHFQNCSFCSLFMGFLHFVSFDYSSAITTEYPGAGRTWKLETFFSYAPGEQLWLDWIGNTFALFQAAPVKNRLCRSPLWSKELPSGSFRIALQCDWWNYEHFLEWPQQTLTAQPERRCVWWIPQVKVSRALGRITDHANMHKFIINTSRLKAWLARTICVFPSVRHSASHSSLLKLITAFGLYATGLDIIRVTCGVWTYSKDHCPWVRTASLWFRRALIRLHSGESIPPSAADKQPPHHHLPPDVCLQGRIHWPPSSRCLPVTATWLA